MRGKLIDLLESAESAVYWDSTDKNFIEKIADYLLANGVIVPPCKVGDTVYAVGYREIYAGAVIEIKSFETEDGTEKTYHAEDDGYPIGFTDEDFGKTVFLTREEAERALREVQGDA